jgi:hypothetical protein
MIGYLADLQGMVVELAYGFQENIIVRGVETSKKDNPEQKCQHYYPKNLFHTINPQDNFKYLSSVKRNS